jgi:hypothetical protein
MCKRELDRPLSRRRVAPTPSRLPGPPRRLRILRPPRLLSRTPPEQLALELASPLCGTPPRTRRRSPVAPPAGHGLHALPAVGSPALSLDCFAMKCCAPCSARWPLKAARLSSRPNSRHQQTRGELLVVLHPFPGRLRRRPHRNCGCAAASMAQGLHCETLIPVQGLNRKLGAWM